MPDITMCISKKCQLSERCHRFKAKPFKRQSYADFTPRGGKCDYFIKMKGGK